MPLGNPAGYMTTPGINPNAPAPGPAMFSIGPQKRIGRLEDMLARQMAQQTPGWGSAIAKMAQTAVLTHQLDKAREERRQQQEREGALRGSIASALAGGGSIQDVLRENPGALSDPNLGNYLQLAKAMQKPERETFETVQDPYGRGGVGQRSSLTGKIVNYQPAAEKTGEWSPVYDEAGKILAQRHTLTGEVKADPRAAGAGAGKGQWKTNYDEAGNPISQTHSVTGEVKKHPGASKRDTFGIFKTEQDARKEWKAESKIFVDTQDAFRRVLTSADRVSPAGDLSMIFNYMKTLDPQSVVRESEFQVAATAGSFGDRVKAAVDRVIGGQRLTPEMRKDFVETARSTYMGQVEQQRRKREQFSAALRASNINPDAAALSYIDDKLIPSDDVSPSRATATVPETPPPVPATPEVPPAPVPVPETVPQQQGMLGVGTSQETPDVSKVPSRFAKMSLKELEGLDVDKLSLAELREVEAAYTARQRQGADAMAERKRKAEAAALAFMSGVGGAF